MTKAPFRLQSGAAAQRPGSTARAVAPGQRRSIDSNRSRSNLTVGGTSDFPEKEADLFAERALHTPIHDIRNCAFADIPLAAAPTSAMSSPIAARGVERVLAGSGRHLDRPLQQEMERRFGRDFSKVRIHSGREAEQSAHQLNANAYTVGNDIVFANGRFAPGTEKGRRLIAHELTHVAQHYAGAADRDSPISMRSAPAMSSSGIRATTIRRQLASRSDWQREADLMTVAELDAEIDRMRDELAHGESSEFAEETRERLSVFEQALLRQQGMRMRQQAWIREQREAGQMRPDDAFITGFVSGYITEVPPGTVTQALDELNGNELEFLAGCRDGVGQGFVSGATGLVEGLESLVLLLGRAIIFAHENEAAIEALQREGEHELAYSLLGEERFLDITGNHAYVARRRHYQQELSGVARALGELGGHIAADPSIVMAWSGELGLALGESLGASVREDFLRKTPREQGVIVGAVVGQVLFEIVLELILLAATQGVGSLVRALPAAGQGARVSARVLRILRELVDASPGIRRIIARFATEVDVLEAATDTMRVAEQMEDVVPGQPISMALEGNPIETSGTSAAVDDLSTALPTPVTEELPPSAPPPSLGETPASLEALAASRQRARARLREIFHEEWGLSGDELESLMHRAEADPEAMLRDLEPAGQTEALGQHGDIREEHARREEGESTPPLNIEEPGRIPEIDPGYDPNWAPEGRHRFPAANRGSWVEGGRGDGRWQPHDTGAYGLEPGQSVPFRDGVPDFREFVADTPSGSPGVFDVEGLTGNGIDDYQRAVTGLAAQEGMTYSECQAWLIENRLHIHHFGGREMQLVPERLHGTLAHQGSAVELRH